MKLSTLRNIVVAIGAAALAPSAYAIDHPGLTVPELSSERFTLIENGTPLNICVSPDDNSAVRIAAENLAADFGRVSGTKSVMPRRASR